MAAYPFLRLKRRSNSARVAQLRSVLDPGESEAIALAEEVVADELLMDERLGRAEARRASLRTVGTFGILLRAKHAGMVPTVIPLIDRLRSELRFFVSDELHEKLRQLAGE